MRLGGRGWGRRQEAGGKGGDGRVFGLLEAEKCPLQSRALSGHFARRGPCNRLLQPWNIPEAIYTTWLNKVRSTSREKEWLS